MLGRKSRWRNVWWWKRGEQTLDRRIPVFVTLTAARQTDDVATSLLYEKKYNKNRSFSSTEAGRQQVGPPAAFRRTKNSSLEPACCSGQLR